VPAPNGESWTFFYSCTLLGTKIKRPISRIYIPRVGKNRHLSSELKVLHKEKLTSQLMFEQVDVIRVNMNLLDFLYFDD
jgi:hypothetical protein